MTKSAFNSNEIKELRNKIEPISSLSLKQQLKDKHHMAAGRTANSYLTEAPVHFRSLADVLNAIKEVKLSRVAVRNEIKDLKINKGHQRSVELLSAYSRFEALRGMHDALMWVSGQWKDLDTSGNLK